MVKKIVSLNVILVSLAVIAGWTLSKAAVIGKVGIHVLHREYMFLNSWWKGALLVWSVWVMLEIIQYLFWIGWCIISIFFIKLRNDKITTKKNQSDKEISQDFTQVKP